MSGFARGLLYGLLISTTARRLSGAQPLDVRELARVADFLGLSMAALVAETEPAA